VSKERPTSSKKRKTNKSKDGSTDGKLQGHQIATDAQDEWLTKLNLTLERLQPFGFIIHSSPTKRAKFGDLDTNKLKELCWNNSFVVLRGFEPLSREEMIAAAKTLGEILEWPSYGAILDIKVEDKPESFIMAPEDVPYHFDGMFFKVPSFQLFQCLQAPDPGAGGETLFCNSQILLSEAPQDKIKLWKESKLTYFTKKTHFGGHPVSFYLIENHPHTGKPTIRYNEPWDSSPLQKVEISCDTLNEEQLEALHKDLVQRIYDPKYSYKQGWVTGDFVLTDNHGQLHGRAAFTDNKDAPRHLIRIHIM